MATDVQAVRVVVTGAVQGVFFRAHCRSRAEELGIRGWVRNRADGAVEAVFAGPAADVDAMVRWCRTGSPQAHVADLRVEPADDPGNGFRVR